MMEMIELTVKDAVLQALEQARGTRLSGGRLNSRSTDELNEIVNIDGKDYMPLTP